VGGHQLHLITLRALLEQVRNHHGLAKSIRAQLLLAIYQLQVKLLDQNLFRVLLKKMESVQILKVL
jgi:hypothetical protein